MTSFVLSAALMTTSRKSESMHRRRRHPERASCGSFRPGSGTAAVSKATSRRWRCIEPLFPGPSFGITQTLGGCHALAAGALGVVRIDRRTLCPTKKTESSQVSEHGGQPWWLARQGRRRCDGRDRAGSVLFRGRKREATHGQ